MKISKCVLLISFLVACFSCAVLAQSSKPKLALEPYVFENSKKEKIEAEMGTLTVPENRAKKNSRGIKLKFVRFKSTSKNPGSPIVYLAGGPGGSGIQTAKYTRFPLFMAMREVADVIAFDQRGTGLSEPMMWCDERLSYPANKAPSASELTATYVSEAKKCAEKFRSSEIDLAGYNTNSSADDLEDLRKALGAKKINLWGISYGTHLALATVKRHPKKIARMILAGVEGPDHTLKLPEYAQNHLANLDSLLRKDAELSKEVPSLLGLIEKVLDKLEKEPKVVEVTNPRTKEKVNVTVNKFAVQLMTWGAFGSGDRSIPAVYYRLSKGDYEFAARRWLGMVTSGRRVGSAMSFMMDCHSGASNKRRDLIKRQAKNALLGNAVNFPFPDVCEAWDNPDAGKEFRKLPKTSVPTLFISGTLDVRTPPSNAEEVRRGFKNSSHLIINGAVHSDPLFLSTPKIQENMLKFMKGEKLPYEVNLEMSKPFTFAKLPGS